MKSHRLSDNHFTAALTQQETPIRSFLKWAGGKYKVLPHIFANLPDGKRLIEPFAGSAVVALNAPMKRAVIADNNRDLISLYRDVRDRTVEFVEEADPLFGSFNSKDDFLRLRDEFNSAPYGLRRSALFVYLNRHGFNGLCRYNLKGGFNVPFGRYKNPVLPKEAITEFAERTKSFDFVNDDFAKVMESAVEGDVVYCDPPYVPLSVTANFTSYSATSFGFQEQRKLLDMAKRCAERGVPVLISNHDTPETRALYKDALLFDFSVHRAISSKASTRGKAKELLALFT